MKQTRVDRGSLVASKRMPDGSWQLSGHAARPGIYLYRRPDGSTFRELVPRQVLQDTAKGLARVAITLGHPDPQKYPKGVTPDNVSELQIGDTGSIVTLEDDGHVRVQAVIRRRDGIQAIERGTHELSPGYEAEVDFTGGTDPEFGSFDSVQRSRAYNHLSVVDAARGGHDVALRVDGFSTEPLRADPPTNPAGTPARGARMLSVLMQCLALLGRADRYDSEEVAGASLVDALRSEKNRRDGVESALRSDLASTVTERDAQRSRADAAERDRDAARADADAAKAKLATLQTEAKTRADAAERTDLADLCARYRVDAAGELPKVKRQIAAAFLGEELRADAGDDEVNGIIRAARKELARGREAGEHAWDPPVDVPVRRDGEGRRPSARERYHAALGLDKATS